MIIKQHVIDGLLLVNYDTSENPFGIAESDLLAGALPQLENTIDAAAGAARAAFVSNGELVEQEYQLAKREAQEWLDAGADTTSVPTCVQDHVDAFGVTATEAANEIVTTGEQWEQAMRDIRTLRLAGKAAVRNADTIEGAEQAANDAIAQLKAYRP